MNPADSAATLRASVRRAALTVAAAGLILLFRRPEQLLRPQFYGEDGIIFFWQAWRWGGIQALFVPYAGYVHLVPRLFAWLGGALLVLWRPAFYNWAAWGWTLGIVILICRYVRLGDVLVPATRVGLALTLVLVPHSGELFLNQSSLQWIEAPLQLLLILQEPARDRLRLGVDCLLLAVTGLDGPMGLLLVPIIGLRWLRYGPPRRSGWALPATVCLAASVQGWVLAHSDRVNVPPLSRHAADWLRALGFEWPGRLFFGDRLPALLGPAFWVITPALVVVFVLLVHRLRDPRPRWFVLALATAGIIFWVAGIRLFADHPEGVHPMGSGSRYYTPFVFTLWILLVLRQEVLQRGPWWLRRCAEALLLLALLSSASHFSWRRERDFHWPEAAGRLQRGEGAVVRVPGAGPEGWHFEVEPSPSR